MAEPPAVFNPHPERDLQDDAPRARAPERAAALAGSKRRDVLAVPADADTAALCLTRFQRLTRDLRQGDDRDTRRSPVSAVSPEGDGAVPLASVGLRSPRPWSRGFLSPARR